MEFSLLHYAFDSWGLCPLDGFLEQHLGLDTRDFGAERCRRRARSTSR